MIIYSNSSSSFTRLPCCLFVTVIVVVMSSSGDEKEVMTLTNSSISSSEFQNDALVLQNLKVVNSTQLLQPTSQNKLPFDNQIIDASNDTNVLIENYGPTTSPTQSILSVFTLGNGSALQQPSQHPTTVPGTWLVNHVAAPAVPPTTLIAPVDSLYSNVTVMEAPSLNTNNTSGYIASQNSTAENPTITTTLLPPAKDVVVVGYPSSTPTMVYPGPDVETSSDSDGESTFKFPTSYPSLSPSTYSGDFSAPSISVIGSGEAAPAIPTIQPTSRPTLRLTESQFPTGTITGSEIGQYNLLYPTLQPSSQASGDIGADTSSQLIWPTQIPTSTLFPTSHPTAGVGIVGGDVGQQDGSTNTHRQQTNSGERHSYRPLSVMGASVLSVGVVALALAFVFFFTHFHHKWVVEKTAIAKKKAHEVRLTKWRQYLEVDEGDETGTGDGNGDAGYSQRHPSFIARGRMYEKGESDSSTHNLLHTSAKQPLSV